MGIIQSVTKDYMLMYRSDARKWTELNRFELVSTSNIEGCPNGKETLKRLILKSGDLTVETFNLLKSFFEKVLRISVSTFEV